MAAKDTSRFARLAAGALALLLISCTPPAPPGTPPVSRDERAGAQPAPQPKMLSMGISTPPGSFSIVGDSSAPAGGWIQVTEVHSEGLVSSEFGSRRPIGRLAEKAPTLWDVVN